MTAKIYHADLYGTRQHKYDTLLDADLQSVEWQELAPNAPAFLFRPQNQDVRPEYEAGAKINEIFPINTIGIVTGQDTKTLAFSYEEATHLASDANLPHSTIHPIFHKPFDRREGVYSSQLITRPRAEVMRHMLAGQNIALVFTRSTSSGQPYDHIFSSRHGMLGRYFVDAACITYFAPLWRYPTEKEAAMGMEREANLKPQFVAEVKERIGETPTPEDIFHYAYAVFHAPTYRSRYAAFLKTDFPRLPLPPNAETFHALAALGATLVALHLLEDPSLQQHGITFPVGGDHIVKKMRVADRYAPPTSSPTPPAPSFGGLSSPCSEGEVARNEPEGVPTPAPHYWGGGASGNGGRSSGRVRLNDTEYFENVLPEAWEFRVGGYQPAAKWLDDRAGRALTEADITHYRRMIAAMRETAALLPQVDAAFQPLLGPPPDNGD